MRRRKKGSLLTIPSCPPASHCPSSAAAGKTEGAFTPGMAFVVHRPLLTSLLPENTRTGNEGTGDTRTSSFLARCPESSAQTSHRVNHTGSWRRLAPPQPQCQGIREKNSSYPHSTGTSPVLLGMTESKEFPPCCTVLDRLE